MRMLMTPGISLSTLSFRRFKWSKSTCSKNFKSLPNLIKWTSLTTFYKPKSTFNPQKSKFCKTDSLSLRNRPGNHRGTWFLFKRKKPKRNPHSSWKMILHDPHRKLSKHTEWRNIVKPIQPFSPQSHFLSCSGWCSVTLHTDCSCFFLDCT